jgi:hypothetical protein
LISAFDAATESVAVFNRALPKLDDNPFYANPQLELGLIRGHDPAYRDCGRADRAGRG